MTRLSKYAKDSEDREKDLEDRSEEEREEVERLVKKSPKNKPPRTDKERRRMKVKDNDLDRKDTDMSMNYKDIGGTLAARIAERFMVSFEFDPEAVEESKEKSKPADGDSEDKSDETDETGGEDVQEDAGDKPSEDPKQVERRAETLYLKPIPELVGMLDKDPKGVKLALSLKTEPLPPRWKAEHVFKDGVISLKARHFYRRHMENWDSAAFAANLTFLKERLLNTSLTSGRQETEHYYSALIELVDKAFEKLKGSQREPLTSLQDIWKSIPDPDAEFSSKSTSELERARKDWTERLRWTNSEKIQSLLDELSSVQGKVESKLSNAAAWLEALKILLEGHLIMKESDLDAQKLVSAVRKGFAKGAGVRTKTSAYRGLPGPLADDDPYKPPQPKWKRPDPLDLDVEDYAKILSEAMKWMDHPFIDRHLLGFDPDMARRIALDYAIHDTEEGMYAARIDAPTYDRLLEILFRVSEVEVT